MCYIREHIIIILCAVIVTDSERWYSAAIFTDTTDFMPNNSVILGGSEQLGDKDNSTEKINYVPLTTMKVENEGGTKFKWHFWKNYNISRNQELIADDLTVEGLKTFTNNFDTKALHQLSGLENTFRRSDYRPMRPKRKVSRRCPLMEPKYKYRNSNQSKKTKFLEVFEVVQFEHVSCTSSSGLEGTCLHEFDCQTAGGSTMGTCADGYGTCCVIQLACDGSYSSPVGWFTNPGFPTPSNERISCTVTSEKSSVDIKQIRLDFLYFEMLPPTSGTCEEDQFIVTGQNENNITPILCGKNTGQHVYIEVSDSLNLIVLSVQSVSAENRLYAIKVSQLTRTDDLAAPTGCLQYYKEPNGYLQSFNYQDNSDIGNSRHASYLNNLNYAMCIERASHSCSITYTNAGEMQIPNYDTDGLPVIPPRQAGVEIFNCPSDWLLISAIRLCGERLNDGSVLQDFSLDAPVTDTGAGPIVVWFRSDGGYVGRGFKLYYLQNACMVST